MGHYAARREVGLFVDVRSLAAIAAWILRNRRAPTQAEIFTLAAPHRIGVKGELDIQGITKSGRAFAVEIKIGKDRLRPEQEQWIKAWRSHNGIAGVIRPDKPGWIEELHTLIGE